MIVASMQPSYWPWLGVFDAMRQADAYVISDDVSLGGPSWRHRNRLRNERGPVWLTIPLKGGQERQPICHVEPAGIDWRRAHEEKLRTLYRRAPFFEEALSLFHEAWQQDAVLLGDLGSIASATMLTAARRLGVLPPCVKYGATLLADQPWEPGDPSGRILRFCRLLKATEYLAASASREYLDVERFLDNGITVRFQDYHHPDYPQIHGEKWGSDPSVPRFVSHLSVLDAVANIGLDGAHRLLHARPGPA